MSAWRIVLTIAALAAAAPALAQGLPNQIDPGPGLPPQGGQPQPPQPPQGGVPPQRAPTPAAEMACFESVRDTVTYIRLEWRGEGRWAVFSWPARRTIKIHVGASGAHWCWAMPQNLNALYRDGCRDKGQLARTGC
jgi:hypothetical protein